MEQELVGSLLFELTIDPEEQKEIYRRKIEEFPNILKKSFNLRGYVLKTKLIKLENALTNEILHDLEDTIRHKHVKVFLLWSLHEQILAKEINNEILEKDPDNLLALTNHAFIFLYYENFYELKRVLEQLKNLRSRKDFSSLVARGKAEIAYCYSRISFHHYQQAIELYKEAVQVCPNNYFWLFRLALLIFRQLKSFVDKEKIKKSSKEATEILQSIRCAYPRYVKKHLMAKTLVLLGSIENGAFIRSRTPRTVEYFQRACSIFPQDRFVLEKSAHFYSITGRYEDARKLLEKAIKVNGTSLSYYYLGIIYRNQIPEYRDFCINKEPFQSCKTQELIELKKEKRVIKCPESIPDIKRNENVNKAEYHFKQSYKHNPLNIHPIYDLALLYISVHEYKNAKKCFEIVNPSDLNIIDKTKFFIQYGKFCFSLADKKESKEIKEDLTDDGTDMFVNAINCLSEILVLDKRQKQIWEIKTIMEGIYNFGNTEYKSNLLKLIQSIKELSADEHIFKKLNKECGGNQFSQMLRLLYRQEKFQQAFLHLEFSDGQQNEIDVNLRKTIYLQYAEDLYRKGPNSAATIFKKYYELSLGLGLESESKECAGSSKTPWFQYDVYILTSKGDEEKAKCIAENLMNCFGLETSYGDCDYIPGIAKTVNVIKVMENSCNIGIFYSKDTLLNTEYAVESVKHRQPEAGKLFLINNNNSSEMPKHLQSFHNVEYNNNNNNNNNEDMLKLFHFLCSG